jgi:methylmalonyl-CoA mutase N-terminal domain/subunit
MVDAGERVVVGVNKYVTEDDSAIPTLKIDHGPEEDQLQRLALFREKRDGALCLQGLAGVRRACLGDENIMDAVLDAVKAQATLGEICQVFREVFGEHRDQATI